ncbi:MAG: hypothetical protein AB1479_09920 [Pseudomonadota bacterium]
MTVIKRSPDIALTVPMRKATVSAPASTVTGGDCACEPDGVCWALVPVRNEYSWDVPWLPYEDHLLVADDGGRLVELTLTNVPNWGGGPPDDSDRWRVVGIPMGPSCGLKWTWSWDIGSIPSAPTEGADGFWYGHATSAEGAVLQVDILAGYIWGMTGWKARLSATAKCGGTVVGELVLIIGKEAGGYY